MNSLIPTRLVYSQPEPRPLINKKSISAPEMAILPAPKGTDYISYMYLLLYQLNLQTRHTAAPAFTSLRRQYKYAGIINTPPPVQIDDFPPLKSRSSVSGPCTRVVSHCPTRTGSGPHRPTRTGSGPVWDLLFLVPGTTSQHCLFARPCSQRCSQTHNWTDWLHTPLRRNVVARSHR